MVGLHYNEMSISAPCIDSAFTAKKPENRSFQSPVGKVGLRPVCQHGCFHHSDVHDLCSVQFSHDPLIRAYHAKIELPIRSDERHFLTDDDEHRHVIDFTGYSPFVDLAPKRLSTPGIGKAGVASDFDSILRCRQHKLGSVRLPVFVQQVINQPKAVEGLTLRRTFSVDEATAPGLAMLAPGTRGFCDLFNRHDLAAKRAISAGLFRRRYVGHGAPDPRAPWFSDFENRIMSGDDVAT
jgi:hypothetical protein